MRFSSPQVFAFRNLRGCVTISGDDAAAACQAVGTCQAFSALCAQTLVGLGRRAERSAPALPPVRRAAVLISSKRLRLLEFSEQRQLALGVPVHSGLWAWFAGCQAPAELPLERRDPFRRAKRPSDRRCPLDPSRRRGIGRCREKRSKIGDQRA